MRTVLCVAEKPSIAKHLAKALASQYELQQSSSKYNPIYKFERKFQG